MRTFLSRSAEETLALGRSFGASLKPGDVVALCGNLGSGKTQFVIGVCEGLGVSNHVGSPTFTLINEYTAGLGKVVHIDLYRIASPVEVVELGIEEYFDERSVCLIEWAETILSLLPRRHHLVRFKYGADESEREISIEEFEVSSV